MLRSLSELIRCGLFFIRNMSLLKSLPILLLFARSSFFDRVTLQLMTSLINFMLFGVSLTFLAHNCLLPLASLAEIRQLQLIFVGPTTFRLDLMMSLSLFMSSCSSPLWLLDGHSC
jgi:hypothetical protein